MRHLHKSPVHAPCAGVGQVSQDGGGTAYEYHASLSDRCGCARTRRFGSVAEFLGGGRLRRRGGRCPGGRGTAQGDSWSGEAPIGGAVRRAAELWSFGRQGAEQG